MTEAQSPSCFAYPYHLTLKFRLFESATQRKKSLMLLALYLIESLQRHQANVERDVRVISF